MASLCVIDVKFLQNQNKKIFAKRVLVSGILSSTKLYSKEIVFPYPINDFDRANVDNGTIEFGSKDIQNVEYDLIKTIAQFDAILLTDNVHEKFIESFIKNRNVKIFNIEALE